MRYRFGPFRLDDVAGRLQRGDTEIELQPKAMALLCCFVRHPERLFGRSELLGEVWPEVVVSDHSLSQALFKLRHALHVPGAEHRWVQTVHGRGYRFVATVVVEGEPEVAPPATRHAFIGRRSELAQLDALWDDGHAGLALVGPGGQGKTRLARHYASHVSRWPTAVFVDLVGARQRSDVLAALAQALGVVLGDDDPVDQLGRALAARGSALVVLDNLDSVRDGVAPFLAVWRVASPDVRWLITSRERVRLPDVHVFVVPGMTSDDALSLFVSRALARSVDLDAGWHDDIRQIAAHLEGHPLGIELAASRVDLLDPAAMHARLVAHRDALGTLADGAPRHRSMHATLCWSWDHLDAGAQRLLASLSLFPGSFTTAQAEAVHGGDVLELLDVLSDHFLVQSVRGDLGRLRLPEPVREFAAAHQVDPVAATRFVDAMDTIARAPRPPWADLPNLRAALALAGTPATKVRIGLAVARMLASQARPVEALRVLDALPQSVPVALQDLLLEQRSISAGLLGGDSSLIPLLRAAATAATARSDHAGAAMLLACLSNQASLDQEGELAIHAGEQAIDAAARAGDLEGILWGAYRAATATLYVGDMARGRRAVAKGLASMRDHHDPCRRAALLDIAATYDAHDGRGDRSVDTHLRAARIVEEAGEVGAHLSILQNAATAMQETGRFVEALTLQDAGYQAMRDHGLGSRLAQLLICRALTHMHLGDLERAGADLIEAAPLAADASSRVLLLLNRSAVACLRGEHLDARRLADQAIDAAPGHAVIEGAALIWRTVAELAQDEAVVARASLARARELRAAGLPLMLVQALDVVEAVVEGLPRKVGPGAHPLAHLVERAARRVR